MDVSVSLEGLEELNKSLVKLAKSLPPAKVEPILLDGAQTIADAAREKAPQGPTGNLKKGCIAKLLRRHGDQPRLALAGVNYNVAPHMHFIEKGTVKMAARPFFRPAWDANKGPVLEGIKDKLLDEIMEAARK